MFGDFLSLFNVAEQFGWLLDKLATASVSGESISGVGDGVGIDGEIGDWIFGEDAMDELIFATDDLDIELVLFMERVCLVVFLSL